MTNRLILPEAKSGAPPRPRLSRAASIREKRDRRRSHLSTEFRQAIPRSRFKNNQSMRLMLQRASDNNTLMDLRTRKQALI